MTRLEKKIIYNNYLNNITKTSESLGINDEVLDWSIFIYSIVLNEIYLFSIDLDDEKIYNQTYLKQNDIDTNSSTISYTYKDLEKMIEDSDYLDKNFYKQFDLKIDVSFLNKVDFDIKLSNSYYDKFEKLLYFDLYLPDTFLNEKDKNETTFNIYIKKYFKNYIKSLISHELLHMFEFSKQDSNKDLMLNFVNNTVKKSALIGTSSNMLDFLELIYLQLSFEENARITQIYIELEDEEINSQNDFWSKIQNTNVWNEMLKLKNFDADVFYSNLNYSLNDNIKDKNINIIFNSLENDADLKDLITQSIITNWNNTINDVNKYFNNNLLKNVDDDILNGDSLKFFKYYEKKFHKTWLNFNKNVGRLYTKFL